MRFILIIISFCSLFFASCGNDAAVTTKASGTDSSFGVALYLHDWKQNDVRASRSLEFVIDTLLPDKTNPEKNVWQRDTFYVIAVPALLIDSVTRKPALDSLGEQIIIQRDIEIPKEAVLEFYKIRTKKKS